MKKQAQAGFTLIELMIVVAIMAMNTPVYLAVQPVFPHTGRVFSGKRITRFPGQ